MSTTSFVLPPELERRYPVVVRGEGVWLEDSEGKRVERGQSQRWRGLLAPTSRDGYAGDQSLFAPPLTTTDAELEEMNSRFARVVREVAQQVLNR